MSCMKEGNALKRRHLSIAPTNSVGGDGTARWEEGNLSFCRFRGCKQHLLPGEVCDIAIFKIFLQLSSIFLSFYLSIFLSFYIFLSVYLSIFLSFYLQYRFCHCTCVCLWGYRERFGQLSLRLKSGFTTRANSVDNVTHVLAIVVDSVLGMKSDFCTAMSTLVTEKPFGVDSACFCPRQGISMPWRGREHHLDRFEMLSSR